MLIINAKEHSCLSKEFWLWVKKCVKNDIKYDFSKTIKHKVFQELLAVITCCWCLYYVYCLNIFTFLPSKEAPMPSAVLVSGTLKTSTVCWWSSLRRTLMISVAETSENPSTGKWFWTFDIRTLTNWFFYW